MLNQEDYVRLHELKNEGWTNREIADELGYHPATIAKWLKEGGPPGPRVVPDEAKVMDAHWKERVALLLRAHPRLLAVSVHNRVRAEGFTGSYPTVVREVRAFRGPRFRAASAASVPIHTDPGEEAQFDFANLDEWAQRWGWDHPLRCFGAILCWARVRLWWFTTSEDRHHTFEGLVRFFEAIGGVPAVGRTDRMGALGSSQGARFVLHPPTVGFAAHHAMAITSCRARDAKRKGKVERPFRQLRETFMPEVEADGVPADLDELNARAAAWIDSRVHAVASRTTGVEPARRLEVERDFLTPLPKVRFDTDYVETRRVHNVFPFIAVDGIRYSVPTTTLGQLVEIRRPVDAKVFTVRWAGTQVATHTLAAAGTREVWDPDHLKVASAEAMDTTRPRLTVIVDHDAPEPDPGPVGRLDLGDGDYDVEAPDLADRYRLDGETGR